MSDTDTSTTPAPVLRTGIRTSPFKFLFGANSDRGGRPYNEDSFGFCFRELCCVSDGIGGGAHGDIMSELCCGALRDEWLMGAGDPFSAEHRIRVAYTHADGFVSRVGSYLGGDSGATLVSASLAGSSLVFAAVGDSMAFLLRDGVLGCVFEHDGRKAGRGNELFSAFGFRDVCEDPLAMQVEVLDAREGDVVLLCSDGVWSQLGQDELSGLLALDGDPAYVAGRIVEAAVKAYGERSDNATALVARVYAEPPASDTGDGELDVSVADDEPGTPALPMP